MYLNLAGVVPISNVMTLCSVGRFNLAYEAEEFLNHSGSPVRGS